jgi:galactokinase
MKTVRAPGRAEVLGNHTDYNEGLVLALAVNRGTRVAGFPLPDGRLVFRSRNLEAAYQGSLGRLEPSEAQPWANYILGVLDGLKARGVALGGMELEVESDLPLGAGLSSSAALEMASARIARELYPYELPPLEVARIGQEAEHRYAGVRCGLLDQLSVLMGKAGHLTFIDCRSYEVRNIPFPGDLVFVLVNSGVKHALAAGDYNERRASCEEAVRRLGVKALRDVAPERLETGGLPERALRRARHVVGENGRVALALAALERGDAAGLGALMFASHASSVENFENSCPELDLLVALARGTPGCLGARLSGGGFGGATINLVERGAAEAFAGSLSARYREKTGIEPGILITGPCAGAG